MSDITTVGLDLVKNVFQVHAVDVAGSVVLRRRLRRGQVLTFFAGLPPCLIGLEACATAHHWARELIALVRLDSRLHHLPDELSGGERQRVAIARALSIYPPIILADEPTGNLDTRTGGDILGLMQDLHTRLGCTVVIVTHDMRVAESCKRTLTLCDGRLVADVHR